MAREGRGGRGGARVGARVRTAALGGAASLMITESRRRKPMLRVNLRSKVAYLKQMHVNKNNARMVMMTLLQKREKRDRASVRCAGVLLDGQAGGTSITLRRSILLGKKCVSKSAVAGGLLCVTRKLRSRARANG